MVHYNRDKINKYKEFNPLDDPKVKMATIGNGSIGGKAKGLIFAKNILAEENNDFIKKILIPESSYISTEIFEDFIERNKLRTVVEDEELSFGELVECFSKGKFSNALLKDLEKLLLKMDYPLAIRSSSCLEDSLKYSFAGKYLTTFIPNRGTPLQRLEQLLDAVKLVYASAYGPNAVAYRKKHKLPFEKMAVIVQRLIGKERMGYFYPELAGVAFSKNYRRWSERIKKEDGVIRIVFGLGTTSTGRGYARTYSLTNLALRAEGNNPIDIARYSQETFDLLEMKTGKLVSFNINKKLELLKMHKNIGKIAQVYSAPENTMKDIVLQTVKPVPGERIVFSFEPFSRYYKDFFDLMQSLFELLEREMGLAVDIEFTFDTEDNEFNLVQARALSSYEEFRRVKIPENIPDSSIVVKGDRMLTNGQLEGINYLVYVDHKIYNSIEDKASVAREVGWVNQSLEGEKYILIGPGRWGSSNKYLGVPVNYSEISNCGVLIELGFQQEGFAPELSYGTHFFADLDLNGILYMPVFDSIDTNIINRSSTIKLRKSLDFTGFILQKPVL
ncbi:MAG: hypothetical protein PWP21_696 [Thermosediminibacterales bacterium]|nr:hypothetical protein [Thermosediminibacterales bacterium]